MSVAHSQEPFALVEVNRKLDRFKVPLHLEQCRRRLTIRETQPVADEVGAVDATLLAKVSAIRVEALAIGLDLLDAVVDPLPDETTLRSSAAN